MHTTKKVILKLDHIVKEGQFWGVATRITSLVKDPLQNVLEINK